MRITNNMLINNMLTSLSNNLSRTAKLQLQQATGKKISKPSDDPIVASKSLKLRTDVAEIAQYKRNTDDATSWMEITESTIGQLGEVMQRVRELTVQGANGTNTTADMQKIRVEVEQLKKQVSHLANATYAGRYVFSGYKTDKPLMDESGHFLLPVDMSEDIQYEIGIGDNINVNVTGGDLFNSGKTTVSNRAGTSMGNDPVTFPVTITAGVNDQLSITIDGESQTVTIPDGTYSDPFVFLSVFQNRINSATTTASDITASYSAGRLLLTSGTSGDLSEVVVNLGGSTIAGSIGMTAVTEIAGLSYDTSGTLTGNGIVGFPLTITSGLDDTLSLTIDGETVAVTIPAGTYATPADILPVVQNGINTATTAAADVVATINAGRLVLTSGSEGASSSVSINVASSSAAGLLGMATSIQADGVTASNGTMITLFDNLIKGLDKGDHKTIGNLLATVDMEIENMLRVRSGVGARMNRLELSGNRLDDDSVGFTKLMSQNEDVDIAEVAMNLMNENTVYQASLATGAKVIQPSLVDYLR